VETVDVAIAGAGIIGLSCALQLRRRGLSVAVFDRGPAMREASWAAAGMLAAQDPGNPSPIASLAARSLALYPYFLEQIAALSGQAVSFRTSEALQALHPGELSSPPGQILTAEEASARLPGLRTAGYRFLHLSEHSLDPRDLCSALPKAALAAGVSLHEHSPVQAARPDSGGVHILVAGRRLAARAFLNCAGAWSSALEPAPHSQSSPVSPRKGQMIVLRLPDPARLPLVLRSHDIYLVPRGDGRVLAGATVEDAGFDKTLSHATAERLRNQAADLWPPAAELPIVDSWTGLRPATRDGLPIIGATAPGFYSASGHFRNGILLAPATAEAVAALITGARPSIDLAPFSPARFPLAA
jgi:glycine oxidase